ncbi:Conserved_hypothetical protein [Hexamita inflata]|uniref:Uncharacterized protein n=1 Tax=Hexamita inflata TaxID=28002 RepID=A0ABP1HHW4_9EUKA
MDTQMTPESNSKEIIIDQQIRASESRYATHTSRDTSKSDSFSKQQNKTTLDTKTSTTTITANYNTIKSSIIQFEESSQLMKQTYSNIIIKRYMCDKINIAMIKDMVQQLVALGELCFTGSGSQKKFNVKSQIQESLENQKLTTNEKIAGAYLDLLFKNTCNDNSKKQLIDLAKTISASNYRHYWFGVAQNQSLKMKK